MEALLFTDPDADRLGVYVKDTKSGEYIPLTGNMSGMLSAEYILRERTKTGTMPENPALVETIVTTDMAKAVAKEYMNFMKGEEREKSYKLYKIASERLVKYMKGHFPLIQLTPIHIQEFAKVLHEENLADTTIRIYLTLIKVILNA